jgi:alkanesulfonate monooxygenase SsuD/methylene tetrahydromethanopterin reductase-like flavin-dependent oxidoreductase (luciferase family)
VDLGIHLPLMQFGSEELSFRRLAETVDTARECGFAAVSANDHFVFSTPWLDGPTALASVIERTGEMTVATTVSLAVLRGPIPLAKMLTALDVLSEGRLIAALGPGSSKRDYDALGISFDERWTRFDEAVTVLRQLLNGGPCPEPAHYYRMPSDLELAPSPRQERGIPLWIGSWGSKAGLRRVARAADGWLASAYNTTPDEFSEARGRLAGELTSYGRSTEEFPNALATMWTWIAKNRAEADRVLDEILAPLLNRDRDALRGQLCVGPPEHCAALLSRYAHAGCQRVYLWPLGDERRQIELMANEVTPQIELR